MGNGNLSIRLGNRTIASHCSPGLGDLNPTYYHIIEFKYISLPLSTSNKAALASCLLSPVKTSVIFTRGLKILKVELKSSLLILTDTY